MSVMSGAAPHAGPLPPAPPPSQWPGEDKLFSELVVSAPPAHRPWRAAEVSVVFHLVALALIILVPILWPGASPETTDYVRALLYDPPPPPPPPLPKGTSLVRKVEPAKPVTPDAKPDTNKFTVEIETPRTEEKLTPEQKAPESEQVGSETGSEVGVADGMEGGTEGGVVGGTIGGVLGGVIGGTGTGPVLDYDQPPRPIKITKPTYPQEAFVKKIEGTVVLEILIDSTGRVVRARVLQSIPSLDVAAVQCVQQWVFTPALKHGRPVMTVANAPVHFSIF